jgi:hypothetical protein
MLGTTATTMGFPDSVFWVGVGQNPTLVTLQRRVAQVLGDPGHFDIEPQGKGKLHELLEHKAVLLVLDDVRDPTHAEASDVLGPRCRAVITTRDAALIMSLGGTSHQVQFLTEAVRIRKGLYVADLQHLFTIRISDRCRTRTLTLDCLPACGEALCEPMPRCESRCPSTTLRCVARSCRLISALVGSPGYGTGVCADGA